LQHKKTLRRVQEDSNVIIIEERSSLVSTDQNFGLSQPVGIRVAQRKLIGKIVNSNHETWNLVVRIFVKKVRCSNTVLERSIMRQARSSRYDK
jgi:hypothetical protein